MAAPAQRMTLRPKVHRPLTAEELAFLNGDSDAGSDVETESEEEDEEVSTEYDDGDDDGDEDGDAEKELIGHKKRKIEQ
jgi:hypothetical protein